MNLFGIAVIVVAAIIFWSYKNKEYAELKAKTDESQKISGSTFAWKSVGIFVVGVLVANLAFGLIGGGGAGDGRVNLFPQGASAKNYRVDAWLVEETNYMPLFAHGAYDVTHVYWGEDGEQDVEVSGCVLKKGEQKTCDVGGETYNVEIADVGCMANSSDDCE
jgi:hypothetical protein